ncbi:hypothetical protein QR680_009561 [Steinernema hermaphroditum]|uniref:Secreted protein n=1 Tax=Steinernema hermaphroditum TaxID=289476 RepID=A0AA39IKT7_9BILA|nr:hypothetical protein QR680_009561 [Steinernema hermaphroditum]
MALQRGPVGSVSTFMWALHLLPQALDTLCVCSGNRVYEIPLVDNRLMRVPFGKTRYPVICAPPVRVYYRAGRNVTLYQRKQGGGVAQVLAVLVFRTLNDKHITRAPFHTAEQPHVVEDQTA